MTWIVTVCFAHRADPALELTAKVKISKAAHVWGNAEVLTPSIHFLELTPQLNLRYYYIPLPCSSLLDLATVSQLTILGCRSSRRWSLKYLLSQIMTKSCGKRCVLLLVSTTGGICSDISALARANCSESQVRRGGGRQCLVTMAPCQQVCTTPIYLELDSRLTE